MPDPLEQLSDSDLEALSRNDLNSMSDEGLQVVAQSGPPPQASDDQSEPFLHKAIREGLPVAGTLLAGVGAAAAATPETLGVGALPAGMAAAGAGNVAGAEAAGWLNHEIYGDEAPTYNSLDDAKRVGTNFAIGAASELGGRTLLKGASALGGALAPKVVSNEVATGVLDAAGNPITKTVSQTVPYSVPPVVRSVVNKAGTFVGAGFGRLGALAGEKVADVALDGFVGTANGVAKVLQNSPSYFGRWTPILTNAATRGGTALAASVYVLQQRDPEFRQKMQDLNNGHSTQTDDNGTSD